MQLVTLGCHLVPKQRTHLPFDPFCQLCSENIFNMTEAAATSIVRIFLK